MQSLFYRFNEGRVHILKTQHDSFRTCPLNALMQSFQKSGLSLFIARFIKGVISIDLNDSQSNFRCKFNGFYKNIQSSLTSFLRCASQRIFAMCAETHAHDRDVGIGNGPSQLGTLSGRPVQTGQTGFALINGDFNIVISRSRGRL